jgi:hypothetical protein
MLKAFLLIGTVAVFISAQEPCIVCPGGINVDGNTETENGNTCGTIAADAAQFDAENEICDLIKGFEELCCGVGAVEVTDAPEEMTETPEETTEMPEADTTCSVCPNGITVAADTPTEGNNVCGGIQAAAAQFDVDDDICDRIKSFESTCCPEVPPTIVPAIGATETASTAAASAGSTVAGQSTEAAVTSSTEGTDGPTSSAPTPAADLVVATNSPTSSDTSSPTIQTPAPTITELIEYIEAPTTNSPTNELTNAPTPKGTAADTATDAPTGNEPSSFAKNSPTPGETSAVETNSPTPTTSPDTTPNTTTPTLVDELSCPDTLSDTIEIDSISTLSYAIMPSNSSESNNGIFCGKLVSDSIGWIGFGISPDGLMSNSTAIIALPDDNSVLKYSLGIERSVNLMSEDQQTLRDSSVTQQDGQTTMSFTKLLVEEGEQPILDDSVNTFIFARGMSNTLGYHGPSNRLSFQIDFGGEGIKNISMPPSTNKNVTASPTLYPSTLAPTTVTPTSASSNNTMPPTAVSNNSTETDSPTPFMILPIYDELPDKSTLVRESISNSYALALEESPTANGASLQFVSNYVGFVLSLVAVYSSIW